MNAVQLHALSLAAHNFLELESDAGAALQAFYQLKELATENRDMRMVDVDFDTSADVDVDMLVHELVSTIEHDAETFMGFGKALLNAAHAGLIEAAIDGTLDSDANNWDLFSLSDAQLKSGNESLMQPTHA